MVVSARVEKASEVRVLALCGESLLMEGIEASLRGREGVKIVLIDASRPDALKVLNKLTPDIIVFDLIPSQMICVFAVLRTHTDVVLIGLDIDSDLALVLSGEWRRLPSVADLMQVVEAQIQAKDSR